MSSFDIEKFQKILNETESNLQKIPQLKKVSDATSLKIVYILLGLLIVLLLLIYIFSGLRALSTLVGVVYPGWCSLKAIKSKGKDDDTFWLSYWVIYGIFSVFESITDLFLFWIPFYELIKIFFYFYLFSPQLKGALTLLSNFLFICFDPHHLYFIVLYYYYYYLFLTLTQILCIIGTFS